MDALFGSEQIHFDPITGKDLGQSRAKNGAFFGPDGLKCTRVSGVLIGRIFPSSLDSLTLYHHPSAARPLDTKILKVNHAQIQDGQLKFSKKVSLKNALDLSERWPYEFNVNA